MENKYRDLRYVRIGVDDLDLAAKFAADTFGLMPSGRTETAAFFRSDAKNYSLCCSTAGDGQAIGLTMANNNDLDALKTHLETCGYTSSFLDAAACDDRQAARVLSVPAPNGVLVEVLWRPMTSGWPFYGTRDAGVCDFQAVSLACSDIAANEEFWTNGMGLTVSDWVGDVAFLALDDMHHRVAIYPSKNDGLLGATWAVRDRDYVMRNWYHLQALQAPVLAGPGCQTVSEAIFVTTRGPGDVLFSYASDVLRDQPRAGGPRQFSDRALSFCAWGSSSEIAEFKGRDAQ